MFCISQPELESFSEEIRLMKEEKGAQLEQAKTLGRDSPFKT